MDKPMELFTIEGRLQTFKKFKKITDAPLCNPANFAKAGFFNISTRRIKDLVKCFACGKELDCWEPGDDPWKEHVRRGSECPFVKFRGLNQPTLEDFLDLQLKVRLLLIELETTKLTDSVRSEFQRVINGIKED